MPRHTHPKPRSKHSRGHIRYQAHRYAHRRWARAKRLWSTPFDLTYDPYGFLPRPSESELERLQVTLGQSGPVYFIHPEVAWKVGEPFAPWPFNRPRSSFARNPWNLCSCWMCANDPETSRQRRAREKSALRLEVAEAIDERWSQRL